jgi:ATP-binding cassette subfamily G (WHITE) protein 2 (PDR)
MDRNVGIILIFWIFFTASYLIASELIASKKSTGEVLLFRRGHSPAETAQLTKPDLEAAVAEKNLRLEPTRDSESTVDFKKRNSTFHWENLCYDIKIKGEPRRILNNVNGWVRPGTLTALMVSDGTTSCRRSRADQLDRDPQARVRQPYWTC